MIITKTPFRISFIGGGSDLRGFYKRQNGKVLTSTIDKYIYVIIKKKLGIVEHKYRVNWSQVEFKNDIKKINHPIVRATLQYFKIDEPLEITTFSDIPANTGLASSSAFAVGLVKAVSILKKKKLKIHDIARIASHIEVDVLKRNIGKQDHFACAYGGFNEFHFYKNERVERKRITIEKKVIQKLERNLTLYFTKIKRNASKVLKSQSKLNVKQFENIKQIVNFLDNAKKTLRNYKELDNFGLILDKIWKLKRKVNQKVSSDKLDKIYSIAKHNGALGGKILGAGNGGFFLFYANKKFLKKIRRRLKYLKNMNFKFDFSGTRVIKVQD
jgi:D-glycero-alpha-D-manno-heptose-7-phosphate kinase